MSLINSLKRDNRRPSGDFNSNPVSNAAIVVTGYDLQGNKSSQDDVMEGLLLHDACGIVAEFDADGVPITPVKIKLQYGGKVSEFEDNRHSIYDMCVGRDGKRTQDENSVVLLDGAKFDAKSGIVTAKWIRRGTPDLDNTKLHWLMPNTMTCVTPQTSKEGTDGKPNYQQSRYFAWPTDAVVIEGGPNAVENARIQMETVLTSLAEGETPPPGNPGFILRVAGLDADGNAEVASLNGYMQWDRETGKNRSVADSVSHFMSTGDGQQYMEALSQTSEDMTWEVIPMIIVRTGLRSLPASKIEEAVKNGKRIDNYQDYKSDAGRFRVGEGREAVYGFAPANTVLQRSTKKEQQVGEDGKKKMVDVVGQWFATSSDKIDVYSRRIFKFDELLTPNLPEAVAKSIDAMVTARADAASEAAAKNRAGAAKDEKAPEADETEEKGMKFGR